MEKPVVSVIMPAYNCEKFIAKAIESVLAQNVSLELIILNDCATDGTERVIQQYLSDQRIRYVKNDRNMGVARTRNEGVRMAMGEYVAFLDSDDYIEKEAYQEMYEKAKQENADFVECDFLWEYPDKIKKDKR